MVVNNQYLEGLVLSILNENSNGTYPYEITSILGKTLNLSDSTIYSVCKRLVKKDLARTDLKTHIAQGRMRKYYFITNMGHQKLVKMKVVYQSEKSVLDRWLGGNA